MLVSFRVDFLSVSELIFCLKLKNCFKKNFVNSYGKTFRIINGHINILVKIHLHNL